MFRPWLLPGLLFLTWFRPDSVCAGEAGIVSYNRDIRPILSDRCFACHGIWFDPQENLKLAPAGVVELFKLLHAHREEARMPLATTIKPFV